MIKKICSLFLIVILLVTTFLPCLAETTVQITPITLPVSKELIEQIGANAAIQSQLDVNRTDSEPINVIVEPGEYTLSAALIVYSDTTLTLTDCIFTRDKNVTGPQYNMIRIGNASTASNPSGDLGYCYQNISIIGGTFDGNNMPGTMIKSCHTDGFSMQNVTLQNAYNAHMMEIAGAKNINITKCKFLNQVCDKTASIICHEAIQLDILYSYHISNYRSEALPIENVTIANCSFDNCPRGIGSHTAILNAPLKNITLNSNTFKNMKSVAIQGLNWQDVLIANNNISNSPRGIALYSMMNDGMGTFLPSQLATEGQNTTSLSDAFSAPSKNMNIVIEKNNILQATSTDPFSTYVRLGISVGGFHKKTAETKQEDGSGYAPVGNYYCSGAIIRNNMVQTTGHGLRLVDAYNCTVSNNTVQHIPVKGDTTSYYGVQCIAETTDCNIIGNTIYDSISNGIQISNSEGASSVKSIEGNTIYNAKKYGICVEGNSSANTIKNNTIQNASNVGININASSVQNILSNNINTTGNYGIFANGATVSSIEKNVISKPSVAGISIGNGSKITNINQNTIENVVGTGTLSGIRVYDKSTVSNIKSNTLKKPGKYGFWVMGNSSITGRNSNVTLISNNLVSGATSGVAYIAKDGKVNTYESRPRNVATKLTFPLDSSIVPVGDNMKFSWKSSNPSSAIVTSKGDVYTTKIGSVTFTSTAADGMIIKCPYFVKFYDVNGSGVKGSADYQYYYDAVYWAVDKKITTGYDKVYFAPSATCKRNELMIFLWRLKGSPTGYGDARKYFNDLSAYNTSTDTNKAIAWAYKKGITKGYTDGRFHPTAAIARKDALIMLYRVAGKPSVTGTLNFEDVKKLKLNKTSDTYKAIIWGSSKGITSGYSDGTFRPYAACLREHIITFLYRYTNLSK